MMVMMTMMVMMAVVAVVDGRQGAVTYPIAGPAKFLVPGADSRLHVHIYGDKVREEQASENVEAL